jgi:HPr kinase/phosphorylase
VVARLGLMRVAGGHVDLSGIQVTTSEVNRPGLQLTGYTQHFSTARLQIIGWAETAYLSDLDPEVRAERLDAYFALGFPALVVARGLHVMPDMVDAADRHNVPVFVTDLATSQFAGALNWYLIHQLAPRRVVPAGLVDVHGEGVLIYSDVGSGQSETPLELVRRGHRLIADDGVELRRISPAYLRGKVPPGRGHVISIEGMQAVDVEELFGIAAVKAEARVSLVAVLEPRDPSKEYERVGLEDRVTELLGVPLTVVTIPVQPGRNLAVLIEAAALNYRQRALGYNAAQALNEKIFGAIPGAAEAT